MSHFVSIIKKSFILDIKVKDKQCSEDQKLPASKHIYLQL